MNDLIFIAGMHRSGTSAIARALRVFGFHFGTRPMLPSPDNPSGYFEDLDITNFNDDLLARMGRSWRTSITRADVDFYSSEPVYAKAVELLRHNLSHGPFAIKDPRLCQLMPLWQRAAILCGVRLPLKIIIAVRNPLAVCASLLRRDHLPQSETLPLWRHHNRAVLNATTSMHRLVVDYDRLLDNPHEQLGRISKTFRLAATNRAEIDAYHSFITTNLRHHEAQPIEDLETIELWTELTSMAWRT